MCVHVGQHLITKINIYILILLQHISSYLDCQSRAFMKGLRAAFVGKYRTVCVCVSMYVCVCVCVFKITHKNILAHNYDCTEYY